MSNKTLFNPVFNAEIFLIRRLSFEAVSTLFVRLQVFFTEPRFVIDLRIQNRIQTFTLTNINLFEYRTGWVSVLLEAHIKGNLSINVNDFVP